MTDAADAWADFDRDAAHERLLDAPASWDTDETAKSIDIVAELLAWAVDRDRSLDASRAYVDAVHTTMRANPAHVADLVDAYTSAVQAGATPLPFDHDALRGRLRHWANSPEGRGRSIELDRHLGSGSPWFDDHDDAPDAPQPVNGDASDSHDAISLSADRTTLTWPGGSWSCVAGLRSWLDLRAGHGGVLVVEEAPQGTDNLVFVSPTGSLRWRSGVSTTRGITIDQVLEVADHPLLDHSAIVAIEITNRGDYQDVVDLDDGTLTRLSPWK